MKKRIIAIVILSSIYVNNIKSGVYDNRVSNSEPIEETIKIEYTIDFNIDKVKLLKVSPKSVAVKRNNPGNLRSVKTGKFLYFDTYKEGYEALLRDIEYKKTGKSKRLTPNSTLRDFVHIYAPPFENNTVGYIDIICNDLMIHRLTAIKDIDTEDLARVIIRVEDVYLYREMYDTLVIK